MQTQKKVRMLEIDLRENTINYNQLISDYELSKQSNGQLIERIQSDNQRLTQYDKDFKQIQQKLSNSLNNEKQMQDELRQFQEENQRLMEDLRQISDEYKIIKTKIIDYENMFEGWNSFFVFISKMFFFHLVDNKSSAFSRAQMNNLKEEIVELNERLRQVNYEENNNAEER
jgi:chromosome segregation ATPase